MQVLGFPEEREPTAGDCYHSKHNEVRALGRALHSVVSGGALWLLLGEKNNS